MLVETEQGSDAVHASSSLPQDVTIPAVTRVAKSTNKNAIRDMCVSPLQGKKKVFGILKNTRLRAYKINAGALEWILMEILVNKR